MIRQLVLVAPAEARRCRAGSAAEDMGGSARRRVELGGRGGEALGRRWGKAQWRAALGTGRNWARESEVGMRGQLASSRA